MKITNDLLDNLIIEQIRVLAEDLSYSIKSNDGQESQEFEDLQSFAQYIVDLSDEETYTINTPQTDGDVRGSGATIKSKFALPSKKSSDNGESKTGYLGDIPISHYRDDMVRLPEIYLQAFKNAGFSSGTLADRIARLNNMLSEFGTAKKEKSPAKPLNEQFSQILVVEFLERVVSHVRGGATTRLKEGGFLFESFLAFILSGTLPVANDSYEDIIDNKLNNISVKFMSEKSSFYQAWSTVAGYFNKNESPMYHISALKERVSKAGSQISFYISEFTYKDYLNLARQIENMNPEAEMAETDKAIFIKGGGVNYSVSNKQDNDTRSAEVSLNEYETGKEPRITFKDYGKNVGGTLFLPSQINIRKKSKTLMDNYNENIDLLFREITNFRKLSNIFFSVSDEDTTKIADKIITSYGQIKTGVNQGFKQRETEKEINEKITYELLDKLVKEVILKGK